MRVDFNGDCGRSLIEVSISFSICNKSFNCCKMLIIGESGYGEGRVGNFSCFLFDVFVRLTLF